MLAAAGLTGSTIASHYWYCKCSGMESFSASATVGIPPQAGATGNLFLAQRFARHASPITTIIYTHPSDEELAAGVRDLRC